MKSTWGDVEKGQAVELNGRAWTVAKIKRKGKKASVKLERKGRSSSGEVRLKDRVKILAGGGTTSSPKRAPLHDPHGAQNRWASEKELREAMTRGLPKGDHAATKPPEPAAGKRWGKPQTDGEATMRNFGARLVAETSNEDEGYYVPPVDVTTVAAHLALFHGGIPEACQDDEGRMLDVHARQHLAALKGEGVLSVNHWHTEKRP